MFHVDVELTIWCEAIKRGCTFSARITDGANAKWYSGTGATALEAIEWCVHEFVARALLGHDATPAMRSDARPGDGLTPASSSRPRTMTPAPVVIGPPLADDPKNEIGCFERRIPTTPAPRLFGAPAATATPTKRRRAGARR